MWCSYAAAVVPVEQYFIQCNYFFMSPSESTQFLLHILTFSRRLLYLVVVLLLLLKNMYTHGIMQGQQHWLVLFYFFFARNVTANKLNQIKCKHWKYWIETKKCFVETESNNSYILKNSCMLESSSKIEYSSSGIGRKEVCCGWSWTHF